MGYRFVLSGRTPNENELFTDMLLMKIDLDGEILWQNQFGGFFTDEAFNVSETTDGGYLVSGLTENFGDGPDFNGLVVKTDAEGVSDDPPESK